MKNIIEFNYSNKQKRLAKQDGQLYVYYPVAIVPVKYWSVEEVDMSIITQTILELGRIRPFRLTELFEKMHIPEVWKDVIQFEIESLVMGKLLNENSDGTYETLKEKTEPIKYDYKEGYMIFDEVRGQFFEYVHEKDLFTSFEQQVDFELQTNSNFTHEYYEGPKCEEQMKAAVIKFNKTKKKFYSDGDQIDEIGILDVSSEEVRVEKKQFVFTKRGLMPIQLSCNDFPNFKEGVPYFKVNAISPFTKNPSVSMLTVIEGQTIGKEAIEWFKELSKEHMNEGLFNPTEIVDLFDRIEEKLAGTKISQTVFEYLQIIEQIFMEFERGEKGNVGNRPSNISTFNLAIEALMQEKIVNNRTIEPPTQWVKEYKDNTLDKLIKSKFREIADLIPVAIMSNLQNIAKKMVQYNGLEKVRIFGNRDYFATLLIVDILSDKYWINKIKQYRTILFDFEKLVSVRNKKGGHHNDELFKMPHEDYVNLIRESRERMYTLIHFLEGK